MVAATVKPHQRPGRGALLDGRDRPSLEAPQPSAAAPDPLAVHIAAPLHGHVGSSPVNGWRRVASDGLYVGVATFVGHLLAAATSLLLRTLLGPAEMGIWQGLKIVLSYANYTNLGTSKAAARELAIARGQGNPALAQRSIDLAFTFNTLTSGGYALAVGAVAMWIGCFGHGPWRWAWAGGLAATGLLAVLQRHVTFLVTLLRSLQAFAITSQVAVLEALLTLLAAGLATWYLGLPGLLLGTAIVFVGSWLWLKARGAPSLHWTWSRGELSGLIRIGGPMLIVGLLTSLFRSLDKLLILGCLDNRETQLGCYSLAILVATQLTGVASMLSIVMGPRFAELLGRAGDRRAAARLAARTLELQAVVLAAAGALTIVFVPALFARMLPEYLDGLAPLLMRTPGLIAFGLTLPLSQYLLAVNQQGRAMSALIVALGVTSIVGLIAAAARCGLAGIALAMTAGDCVQLALLLALSFTAVLDRHDWSRLARYAGLAILPGLAAALILEQRFPGAECSWQTVAAKMAIVLAVVAPCGVLVGRFGGWAAHWRKEASCTAST